MTYNSVWSFKKVSDSVGRFEKFSDSVGWATFAAAAVGRAFEILLVTVRNTLLDITVPAVRVSSRASLRFRLTSCECSNNVGVKATRHGQRTTQAGHTNTRAHETKAQARTSPTILTPKPYTHGGAHSHTDARADPREAQQQQLG